MAGIPSDRVLRQVHRLFNIGVVGTMSDAELLDRFISRRDESAETAFEELVSRHGPMVLRVCRSVLRDAHDAEDAFQAVFLVLANRARSIHRRGSVANWLFGVAQRVAIRGKRSAARRHALDQLVAGRTSESYLPPENDPDAEILHEEVHRLPERLRAPVVLCYLQGLTYAAAAHQLGLSEVAIQGRLARARGRLRHKLIRRGATIPAGLLAAGAASQAQAAIPLTLIHSTSRIALGFLAGNTAAALAQGVLNSMLLNQVRVGTVLILFGIGSSYWTWRALAAASDSEGQASPKQAATRTTASAPKSQMTAPATTYRFTGSVRVEGTGEPVQGAELKIQLGDLTGSSHLERIRRVTSGKDGQFFADLPSGQASTWGVVAPAGYWAPASKPGSDETFVLSPAQPTHHKDYLVRRGIAWPFRLTMGADQRPARDGSVDASIADAILRNEIDASGLAYLTLPSKGGSVTAYVSTDRRMQRRYPSSVPVAIPLEWARGFRPDAVRKVERLGGRFRLTDDAGRVTTIGDSGRVVIDQTGRTATRPEAGRVEPIITGGQLVIVVNLPESESIAAGDLAGQVIDDQGRPIDGVLVSPAFHIHEGGRGGGVFPDDAENRAVTDQNGKFLIRGIRCPVLYGRRTTFSLVVRKEGYASLETPEFSAQPGKADALRVLDPIRLEPAVSLTGTVVDPEGRPAAGVWVTPLGSFGLRGQSTRTDTEGKFTVRNLPKGLIEVAFQYGPLEAAGEYLADGVADEVKIQLRPKDATPTPVKAARPTTPQPPALGHPAPPLQVVGWTDGKSRSLVDYRGKVVFLDFWGIWCGACLNEMPNLERLKQKYEPRGVVFLSIHTPGEEIEKIHRFLDLKKSSLVSALDEHRRQPENSYNGVTADRYGVRGYPTLVLIDRQGNLAFHTGIDTKEGVAAMKARGKEMGIQESTMTKEQFQQLWEDFFGRKIEKVLNRP
jgi:RNA polymerase sigma factor (sigma-70 family)